MRNYNVAVSEKGDQVVFQHRIVPGGADRSYGIHVAQLAGLPRAVISRAQEMLEKLEANGDRRAGAAPRPALAGQQLPLFTLTDPIVEELRSLDVTSMTPLEAINKLFELQKKAQEKR